MLLLTAMTWYSVVGLWHASMCALMIRANGIVIGSASAMQAM